MKVRWSGTSKIAELITYPFVCLFVCLADISLVNFVVVNVGRLNKYKCEYQYMFCVDMIKTRFGIVEF